MRGDLDLTVSADGVVQPINKVEIRSKASGQILELNFEEGSVVKKGDLLVALDQTQTKNDYDQAKADLASAQQSLAQAENNARRSKDLHEKGLISVIFQDYETREVLVLGYMNREALERTISKKD